VEKTDGVKHSTLASYGKELNTALTCFMIQALEGTHFEIEKPGACAIKLFTAVIVAVS
jgi:hypothetical protein